MSSMKASAIGTLRESDAGRLRRVAVWIAALVAAMAVAASAGILIHRATTTTTVPPASVTQQQSAPQERAADPSKRLIEINDQPGSSSAPVAPALVHRPNRLVQQNS